jgi:hypothetical protein
VSVANTPYFSKTISCPAWIIGEHCDSGHDPGLDEKSKKREIINDSRTNYERELGQVSESRSGLKIGDFTIFLL